MINWNDWRPTWVGTGRWLASMLTVALLFWLDRLLKRRGWVIAARAAVFVVLLVISSSLATLLIK